MRTELKSIPKLPGIYLMRDSANNIVYIGKATNLYSRIKSYFTPSKSSRLVNIMFENIKNVDYIVCGSNREAMLLEQKLIKAIQPKYNILWRDDKSYPYIEITTSEPFPRINFVRSKSIKKNPKNLYFGPYPNTRQMKSVVRWITKFFKLRLCKLDSTTFLTTKDKTKFSSCIYYQTDQCLAPCMGKVTPEKYADAVKNVKLFLNGKYKHLLVILKKQLDECVKTQDYESAIIYRNVINYINNMFAKLIFREITEEDIIKETVATVDLLKKLKEKFSLTSIPVIIEAIDVSNLYGEKPTGAVVRFVNGKPDKSSYRRFSIKTLSEGKIDDYSMIKEVFLRRYSRLINEKKVLPNLILIDGGKGQLNVAKECLTTLALEKKVDVISLAKQKDEIYLMNKDQPVQLSTSPEDNLLRYIRDEAHRFAISYHKLLRKKQLFS